MTADGNRLPHEDEPDEDGITWRMRRALYDVVATYGDSSVTLVAERAYLAMRNLDPAFLALSNKSD